MQKADPRDISSFAEKLMKDANIKKGNDSEDLRNRIEIKEILLLDLRKLETRKEREISREQIKIKKVQEIPLLDLRKWVVLRRVV
jgi:hypothetical protein